MDAECVFTTINGPISEQETAVILKAIKFFSLLLLLVRTLIRLVDGLCNMLLISMSLEVVGKQYCLSCGLLDTEKTYANWLGVFIIIKFSIILGRRA